MITFELTYILAGLTVAIFALAIAIMLYVEKKPKSTKHAIR